MKKRTICLLLALILACGVLTGCAQEPVRFQDHLQDYVRTMDYHDGFTVLQLTDIHWNSGTQVGDGTFGSEGYLRKVVEEAAAHAGGIDLIEITGDTFMLAQKSEVTSFIDFMTSLGIPYAITWGNHDREGEYNPNWLSQQFREAPYSLYTEIDGDDVHERSNYIINLLNADGSVAWQMAQLDSGASYRKGAGDVFLTYDFLREDQFAWLMAEHEAAGENVPVICWFHIAQADNDVLYDAMQSGTECKNGFSKLEGFAASKYAPMTGEVFADCNVKGVFNGHAHAIDWTVTNPDGIVYGLGVKSGQELYYGQLQPGDSISGQPVDQAMDLIGASLVTLNDTQGSFTLEHLYLNERENGDLVLWVKY